MTLSTIILAHQNSYLLRQAIKSASASDEILVIWDANSVHQVPKIAAKIIPHPLKNFASQRNFALNKAKGDWILFIDSDEQISPRLSQQIQSVISKKNFLNGYHIPRLDIFYNQQLNYGETGDIKILRLARRNAGRFSRPVHEKWKLKGKTDHLTAPIFHHRTDLTSSFVNRMIKYSLPDAKQLTKENKPFAYWRVIAYPPAKFLLNYIIKQGALDGLLGLFHAYLMSVQSLTVRVYQWENRK